MLDIKWIRDNPEAFDAGLGRRGLDSLAKAVLELDARRRAAQGSLQDMQTRRNEASKRIGALKGQGAEAEALKAEVAALKDSLREAEELDRALSIEQDTQLASMPNLPAADVPDGPDESFNQELRKHGTPPELGFPAREHFEIGESLGLMDFDAAAKMSGARFVVLKGALARLERALGQFMLDLHTEQFGYTEVNPPILVRDTALFGTGQLPKFGEDLFATRKLDKDKYKALFEKRLSEVLVEGETGLRELVTVASVVYEDPSIWDRFWMIPTAEVPLTNLVSGEILDGGALPLRMTALTPCFRSEAGAAGKDTRGMIRQHQFPKVELVSIAHPDHSEAEHERMTACAEEVLKRLGLAYRVIVLSTGDMGFSARKTYDIEVWLPGQGRYREISSCSNCGEFQARRMKARFRTEGDKGTRFVHTLNGSGLAVGRTLIAVLENYQQADGSVLVPEVLRPYMGGVEAIRPHV